nr:MAG TPA: hypothetical protein [Caudoviricetes sp.]
MFNVGNDNGWFNQRTLDAMAFIGFMIGLQTMRKTCPKVMYRT